MVTLEEGCKEESKTSVKTYSGEKLGYRKTRTNNKEKRNNGGGIGWTGR